MAFTDKSFSGKVINNMFNDKDQMMPCIYNLSGAVGRGCPNRVDDVMLVQALLGVTAESLGWMGVQTDFSPKDVTGKYNHKLAQLITRAQRFMKQMKMNVPTDGKAHPARQGAVTLIECLNILAFQARGVWFTDFPRDFNWCSDMRLRRALLQES